MAQGFVLLADVTGRELITALARPGESPQDHSVIPCEDLRALEAGLRAALAGVAEEDLVGAGVCARGPEIDGAITITSTALTLSVTWLRSVLKTPRVYLVNDFTACAMGAPKIPEDGLEIVHPGVPARSATIAVVGPDIGLGVACLAPLRGDGWLAVPSEGGHMDFCPAESRETPIFAAIRDRYGDASAERLLSREGLSDIHCILANGADPLSTPLADGVVLKAAREGDPVAAEAVSIFSALLGGFCGDIALLYAARGGIYLNSPLLEDIGPLLDREAFARRFRAKGKMAGYVAGLPVLMMHGRPALLGLSSLFTASDMRYAASEIKFLDC